MRINQLLRGAVSQGVAPAVALAVSQGAAPTRHWYAGKLSLEPDGPACGPETVFDLASLTKALSTTLWCLHLIDQGRLDLDSPLADHLPLADPALARAPLWRLMNHTAGFVAHQPYFAGLGLPVLRSGRHDSARAALRRMLLRTVAAYEPGTRELYSDLGYLVLEWICERVDRPLTERWPTLPGHGPHDLHFRPLPTTASGQGYAPTERCPWRHRLLRGEVHDDNCWTMGGVAGHAGAFGTLRAVHDQATRCLFAARGAPTLPFSADLFARAVDRRWMHPLGTRVLGWDTPTPGASTSGTHFGRRSFGHLGFTGTSVWIDPDAEVVVTLLTNRICPSRGNWGIRALRPALHDAAWELITAGEPH